MPYPRKLLHDAEEIMIDRHPHGIALFPPIAAAVGALMIWIVGLFLIDGDGLVGTLRLFGPLALLAIALLWLLKRWTIWRTTNFVVTTDRLIYRSGVVSKAGKEIPLERINDISFSQTVFERLIKSGDLLIESGGEHGQQRFSNVRNPVDVQNQIYRQMERTQARDMDRMAGRRALSVPEQIEKLHGLVRQGALTQAEFEAKKQQLLALE